MPREMIENAIRCGKIETRENAKKLAPRRKENEVNNTSVYNKSYNKPVTVSQPRMVTTSHQGSTRQDSNSRPNTERVQFTPISMSYKELYQSLFDAHVVSPFYLKPLQPSFPKWYDTNTQCEYHAGITGHSIENCTAFKKLVKKLIEIGIIKFGDSPGPNVAGNLLPDHANKGVNTIVESGRKRIKIDVSEVKTLFKWVWEKMVEGGLVTRHPREMPREARRYCELLADEGYDIQECNKFRSIVLDLMDNKEMEFYEEIRRLEEGEVYATEEGTTERVQRVNHPVVIISRPKKNEAGVQLAPRFIIQKPISFPYKDSKKVPWNYDCNVTIPGGKARGRCYDPVSTKNETVKKKSPMVEQRKEKTLRKQPARISVLALLLSSETYRNALMKVLNETYVANDISVNKLDRLVNNISADNFIFFNDDEIPLGGMGSTKALHITTHCKGYTLPGVLIDNGSALNVLPLSTLNRFTVDSSHMKACQNVVRTFDGTERKVMKRIGIPLLIDPSTYEVDFFVMDIKPSYNYLLERPWIHSAGAVLSSLHQKLKFITEGRLVTINAEEDIIASVTSNASYLGTDDETIEYSFRLLEFVNATFVVEGNKIPTPRISKTTRMGLRLTVGKGALPGKGLGRSLQGKVESPMLMDK
ncbi:uncharacterized protein LOC108472325 [Gossypium arboreum]|uniref:uncharacterized protein LOC108472325 n=1 Tax=Gossypium arboreum TaxID=29729 RepID=UPI0008194DA9|nr:uncharacterized protein LOC108472325 [Gossypium arboreum]